MPLGGKMTPKIDEKPVKPQAKHLQKMASIPFCFSIVCGVKTGGRAPNIRLHRDLPLELPFMVYGFVLCSAALLREVVPHPGETVANLLEHYYST